MLRVDRHHLPLRRALREQRLQEELREPGKHRTLLRNSSSVLEPQGHGRVLAYEFADQGFIPCDDKLINRCAQKKTLPYINFLTMTAMLKESEWCKVLEWVELDAIFLKPNNCLILETSSRGTL